MTGFWFGLSWFAIGMGWMWFLTAPGYVFTALLFAGFHATAAAAAPTGRWRVIGRPAAHTLVETVRLGFPFGGVPLATLGISQAAGPLLGLARVGGVVLITWVVFQVGFALPSAIIAAGDGVRCRSGWPASSWRWRWRRWLPKGDPSTAGARSRSPPCRAVASRALRRSTCRAGS
jgi:apolipoprotein N-acyltransferase